MKRRLTALLLVVTAALALAPRAGAAQELTSAMIGQRIRIELASQGKQLEGYTLPQVVRGTLIDLPPDSVRVRIHEGATAFTIADSAIAHVDLSHGVRTAIESGMEGMARGDGLGALQWGLFNGLRKDPVLHQSFLQSVMAGAIVGGVIGGILGVLRPEERWERIR